MLRNILDDCKITYGMVTVLTAPTIDADGTSVDMTSYDFCTILACVGDSGDTLSGSVKIELEVEESDDDSSYTDVADTDLSDYVAGANDGCFALIDAADEDQVIAQTTYKGSSKHCRAVLNVSGTHTNGTPLCVVMIQHGFHGEYPVV